MAKVLTHFTITQEAEGYLIHLEDEDGEEIEMQASYEQLDLIVEAISEQLDSDEEDALAVDDDETDEAEDED